MKSVEEGYYKKDFEVISGEGCGILEDCYGVHNLKKLVDSNLSASEREISEQIFRGFKNYRANEFHIERINEKIDSYLEFRREQIRPKHYILNISLEEYEKVLKRKISVDSNVSLDSFCKCVVVSMGINLDYAYTIKINRECLEEDILETEDLNYLNLKEKQKFKILYNHENNWIFNVTVSKINDGYGKEKRVKILSGIGYGIIEDCGGISELKDIFNSTSKNFDEQDINDFDIEKMNQVIDRYV